MFTAPSPPIASGSGKTAFVLSCPAARMSPQFRLLTVAAFLATANAITTPLEATVEAGSKAWFGFETVQLTDDSLAGLDSATAALFQFYDETESPANAARSSAATCKVFPGDAAWPSSKTWNTLSSAVGKGALIKTIPLAAPCYNSWGYNQAECADLTANWTNSYLQ